MRGYTRVGEDNTGEGSDGGGEEILLTGHHITDERAGETRKRLDRFDSIFVNV